MNITRNLFCVALIAGLFGGCSSDDSPNEPVHPSVDNPVDAVDWTFSSRIDLSPSEEEAVNGINEFSFALMKEIAESSPNGQFSLSPVSVAIYLGMLANATSGDVNVQILQALDVKDINTLNSTCEKLMRYLPFDENGSSISLLNRFWIDDAYTVPESLRSIMASSFNAEVETVDFGSPTTVPAINKWVSDNTMGLIPSLLDGDWRDYVSLHMANANTVYFKGLWKNKFDINDTKTEKFQTTDGSVDVKMMRNTIKTAYAYSDMVEMVRMEFEGPINSMYIYLPAEGVSVKQLVSLLTPAMQAELRTNSEICDITLGLPRFEMRTDIDLNVPLASLGISNLNSVDLSPMGLGILPVSTIHKASIKIEEEGAEMAALTGGWYGANLGEKELKKVTINFDRPFVYIIRNYKTDAIMMAGAVIRP